MRGPKGAPQGSNSEIMKKVIFTIAVAILMMMPVFRPIHGQDGLGGFGEGLDVTGLLGDRGRGGQGRGGIQMPDSRSLLSEIQSTLKKGKTPMDKAQEKPVKSLLDAEIVILTDKIQLLRNNNNNNNNQNFGGDFGGGRDFGGGFQDGGGFRGERGFPGGGGFPGGERGGGNPQGQNQPGNAAGIQNNNQLPSQLAGLPIQIETLTDLKNDDFVENKLASFLTPQQAALIQKAKADDKTNATCLAGLFDRAFSLTQNLGGGGGGRGGNNNNNNNNNNIARLLNLDNPNGKKENGQAYCMTAEATPSDRLEPIRKVLVAGNLPLAKDKEQIAEIFMRSQIQDLQDSLRAGLTASFSGNRGGNNRNNPQQLIQTSQDNMYKKVEEILSPAQAETLKKWHYNQILSRGGIEALITLEELQGTPLNESQIARVTIAFPEFRNQLLAAAKASNKNTPAKDIDQSAMTKVLAMLEPPQVASFQDAVKLGTQK